MIEEKIPCITGGEVDYFSPVARKYVKHNRPGQGRYIKNQYRRRMRRSQKNALRRADLSQE